VRVSRTMTEGICVGICVCVYVCVCVSRTMAEGIRDQLLITISKTFHCVSERAEQIFVELMLCVRKKHLVSLNSFPILVSLSSPT